MTLTTGELTGMRAASDAIMPDTCTITRITRSQSATGAWTESPATLASGVSCRLDTLTEAEETSINETLGVVAKFALALNYAQDIKETDRITHNSLVYEVVAAEEFHSWLIHKRCYLKRMQS